MITTSARLLRLLALLQSRRHWTSLELCDRLAMSARTVRRDVDRLRELGYPIHASPGLGGGYSMRPGSAMPPVLLEDDEAVAVAVALRAAAGSIAHMDEAAIGVLAKIDRVMPARLRKRASSLHSITVSLPGAHEAPAADALMQIAGACRDQKKLTIGYADRSGRESSRRIEPVRLAHTGRRWYLVAWDIERNDWRTFRADRIRRVVEPGTHFTPRKLPRDVVTFVSQSIAYEPYSCRARLKLEGSHGELSKRIASWIGVLEPLDEQHCVLSVGAPSPEALVAFMLMAGVDFQLLDAKELLPQLREIARHLNRAFGVTLPRAARTRDGSDESSRDSSP
jgi:predicted DNA-binding transcriptional regulator YafY